MLAPAANACGGRNVRATLRFFRTTARRARRRFEDAMFEPPMLGDLRKPRLGNDPMVCAG